MEHIISIDLGMEITLPDGSRYVKLLAPARAVPAAAVTKPVVVKATRRRHTGPPREFEHKGWPQQEIVDLIKEKLAGKTNRACAKSHGRTPKAIAVRVSLLRKQGLLPPSTRAVRAEVSHVVVKPEPPVEVK